MCPRNLYGSTGKRFKMSYDMFKDIIEQLPNLRLANFAGLGEPFSHPDILQMFNDLASKHIDILLTTNGTLLTEDIINKLPRTNFQIHVSIDSPIPESFKKLRHYDLDLILDNLRMLRKIRPDIKIVLQALYMKNTMGEFPFFVDILKELKATLAFLYPISFKHEDEDLYEPFLVDGFMDSKNAISKLLNEQQIPILDRPFFPIQKQCAEPWNGPMINPKGEVFPCCYVYEARNSDKTPDTWEEWYKNKKIEVPQYEYIMGNMENESIESIWNNNKYEDIRKTVAVCNSLPETPELFEKVRNNIHLNRYPYSYCRICLWRWNQAC